ncbi:MAG TPA: signal peptidase II [Chloroflexi bacterium]|nr:signal peptidase II [Chloroflexota bacterium]
MIVTTSTSHPNRRMFLPLLIVLLVLVIDQATKALARTWLALQPPMIFGEEFVAGGLARLTYFENPGAFLGLGADLPAQARFWVFTVVAVLLLSGLVVYAWRASAQTSTLMLVGISLLVAGGIGNLIDRIVNDGRVVDFMFVGVGWLRTGVFNVADMALTAGVIIAVFASLRRRPEHETAERHAEAPNP